MKVEIRVPQTDEDFQQYYELRWKILRAPWTDARESERDEHEKKAIHVTAWAGETLAGVGRVHFNSPEEAQIRYMAVDDGYRGQGIGSIILRDLEERAVRNGARTMILNARESALTFYRRHGYRVTDQASVLFDSIAHWEMRKDLQSEKTDNSLPQFSIG